MCRWGNELGRGPWLLGVWGDQVLTRLGGRQNLRNGLPQFLEAERLEEQSVNQSEPPAKYLEFVHKGGGHDDGLIRPDFTNAGDELIPMHAGHGEIRDDQIKPLFRQAGECGFAAIHSGHPVSVVLQEHLYASPDNRLIVSDQNLKAWFHGPNKRAGTEPSII